MTCRTIQPPAGRRVSFDLNQELQYVECVSCAKTIAAEYPDKVESPGPILTRSTR